MRSRILPAVGISAIALVAAAAFAPGASASGHGMSPAAKGAVSAPSHAKTAASCYNQADNDNGVGIVSQNFEATFDQYDAQGADDFKIAAGGCKIKIVHADGLYFNGAGPAVNFTVEFYKSGTTPTTLIKSLTKKYVDTSGGLGSVDIKLGKKGPKLDKGKYWVSVIANLDFQAGGEWGWNTNNTQRQLAAVWQNPGNGFGSGCTTWGNMVSCIGALGQGPDFSFSLSN